MCIYIYTETCDVIFCTHNYCLRNKQFCVYSLFHGAKPLTFMHTLKHCHKWYMKNKPHGLDAIGVECNNNLQNFLVAACTCSPGLTFKHVLNKSLVVLYTNKVCSKMMSRTCDHRPVASSWLCYVVGLPVQQVTEGEAVVISGESHGKSGITW